MAKAKVKDNIQAQRKAFFEAMHQLVTDKGFDRDEVLEIIEAGLIAAYRRKYKTTENVRVVLDKEKEDVYLIAARRVVENIVLPGMEILISEAKELDPSAELGGEVDVIERPHEYGRIAAQTAMQVVSQKLRVLEQKKIKEDYSHKIGELINGYILRKRGDTVYVDLGKVEAIMPVKHQIPGERYRVEDKIKVLLHSIEDEPRGGMLKVIVSRGDKKFVQKLFEMEVPEIYDGIVEVKAIGRIAGIRSKVVVASSKSDVDPVGACVGVRGVRIQAIVRELGNERIDIIEHSDDSKEFITNALSPATPTLVKVDPIKKEALAVVADKDLSIAIGKDGSNVKIASYISTYKIDVKSESQFSEEMASPEARKKLDELFGAVQEETEEEEGTPLSELPGLTRRIIKILAEADIQYIEDLIELEEEDLIAIEGMGTATAKKIMESLSENIEFAEDEEEEAESEEAVAEDSEGADGEDDTATEDVAENAEVEAEIKTEGGGN